MRWIAVSSLAFSMLAAHAPAGFGQVQTGRRPAAAPAPEAAQPAMEARVPAPNPKTDKLLHDWELKSAQLTTLSVRFSRVDVSKAWPKEYYQGNAFLQSPNLACLHFEKLPKGPQEPKAKVDHERIVVTGKEVRQYDYAAKEIFVFPLDRDQRNRALQEGPLPFLFNMKASEAKARYVMTIKGENDNAYLIEVVPRLENDRDVFSRAYLQLNKASFLPDRLMLVATNEKDTQDYTFSNIRANQPIDPVFFRAADIKGWAVRVNPAQGPGAAGAAAPPAAAGRPQVGARPQARPR